MSSYYTQIKGNIKDRFKKKKNVDFSLCFFRNIDIATVVIDLVEVNHWLYHNFISVKEIQRLH